MRTTITDIYRIETQNSVYEIKVVLKDGQFSSVCKKMGDEGSKKQVKALGTEYLAKLCVGPSFDIPGVVLTSRVVDYAHFVLSNEPKRTPADVIRAHQIAGGMKVVTDHVIRQANGWN